MKSTGFSLAVMVGVSLLVAPPASAGGVYDANALWAHEDVAPLGERITMWECWEEGLQGRPRLEQKIGKKWKRLDVSSVKRDEQRCGEKTPMKATYKFTLRNAVSWNVEEREYEVTVRTRCRNCESYDWTILVDK